jgi:hypothetical protein
MVMVAEKDVDLRIVSHCCYSWSIHSRCLPMDHAFFVEPMGLRFAIRALADYETLQPVKMTTMAPSQEPLSQELRLEAAAAVAIVRSDLSWSPRCGVVPILKSDPV